MAIVSGRMLARVLILAGLGTIAFLSAAACGNDPVGIDACQRIEKVRCESAQACGVDLARPLHSGGTAAENVASCTRYYDDQCLHGLSSGVDPGDTKVTACVNAIATGDCNTVKEPQTNAACSFLTPVVTATTTDAGDAATGG